MTAVAVFIGVVLLLLGIGWFRRQPGAATRKTLTRVLLVVAIFAVLLAVISGRIHPLIAALGGAFVLLQRLLFAKRVFDQFKTHRGPDKGGSSEVSTRFLDMSLDHDSAQMHGTVREGRFAGRTLAQLSLDELLELLAQCRSDDAQSAAVLEAYLEHVHGADWREHLGPGAEQQSSGGGSARMSEAEAREILGIDESAGREEIVAAHRKLMQKLHPDRGGSTYLAAKVNQAKEVLSQ